MNKRIRELMAEAVTFRLDPDSNAHEAQVCPEDLELFAELIIAECCVALHPMLRDMISRTQGVDLIVKHFGVE
jgi:hypothetical protein